ncbi:hypothetical protein [uncultured Methanoregula sp.]|uniref:hypothetical protein n=1 Tax=uncultured Methanoregula sp. TaxID=1005933 RepID=UPI002AAA99EF|nr:hypothetical protein [uncultured Methanoregula sp.]
MPHKKTKKTEQNNTPFREQHKYIYDIGLLFLGAIIGLLFSLGWAYFQDSQTDRYTAQGLYNELNNPDNEIPGLAMGYEQGIYMDTIHIESRILSGRSYFSLSSMYPSIKDKLQRFDSSLSKNITLYYENLSVAENERKQLEDVVKISPNQGLSLYNVAGLYFYNNTLSDMKNRIIYCAHQMPVIKKQLQENYGVK